jgi:hypothetical protein
MDSKVRFDQYQKYWLFAERRFTSLRGVSRVNDELYITLRDLSLRPFTRVFYRRFSDARAFSDFTAKSNRFFANKNSSY